MDPIILATSFASIVTLIANFRQERRDQKNLETSHFLEWLEEHHFLDTKSLILSSQELIKGIDIFLKQDTQLVLEKLFKIEEVLALLLSRISGLKEIAHFFWPNRLLSDQAIAILRQLVNSNSEEFYKIEDKGPDRLSLLDGNEIYIQEPRFVDDDLETLVDVGLLRYRQGSSGIIFYGVTRYAVSFITAIDNTS